MTVAVPFVPCAQELHVLVLDANTGEVIPDADIHLTARGGLVGSGRRGRIFTINQLIDGTCEGASLGVSHRLYFPLEPMKSDIIKLGNSITVKLHPKSPLTLLKAIRLRVYGSGGFGHRVAALLALRALSKIGFRGKVELLYTPDPETISILGKLLPEFGFNGARVLEKRFESLEQPVTCYPVRSNRLPRYPEAEVLGLAAASDEETAIRPADFGPEVKQFICLQPYRYFMGGHKKTMQRMGDAQQQELVLHENVIYSFECLLPPDVPAFVRAKVEGARGEGLARLLAEVEEERLSCLPVYGLRGAGIPHDADTENMVANIVGGAAAYHTQAALNRPIIVLMLNDHDTVYPVAPRVVCVTISNLPALLDELPEAADDRPRVIYVRCGGIPFHVFECILAACDLPPVTEGNNTINQLIMLRKPFMSAGTGSTSFPVHAGFNAEKQRCDQAAVDIHTAHPAYIESKTRLTLAAECILHLRRLHHVVADKPALRALIGGILSDVPVVEDPVATLLAAVSALAREPMQFLTEKPLPGLHYLYEVSVATRCFFPRSPPEREPMELNGGFRPEGTFQDDLAARINALREAIGAALQGGNLQAVIALIQSDDVLPVRLGNTDAIAISALGRRSDVEHYAGNFADHGADLRNQAIRGICTELQARGICAGAASLDDADGVAIERIRNFIADALNAESQLHGYFKRSWDQGVHADYNQILAALSVLHEKPVPVDPEELTYVVNGKTIEPDDS